MTLSDYISDRDRRLALADAVMTSPQWLWQVATGWRGKRVGARLALDIERATEGAVTRSTLRPDFWPPQSAAAAPTQQEVA